MPADTNHRYFGGWLLGQMTAGNFRGWHCKGRTATVAVDAMTFRNPVSVETSCAFPPTLWTGNTSVTVHVEAWVIRRNQTDRLLVTDGNFTYVALDDERRPRPIEGQDYVVR
jgi:acyl-CoA thioesterase YciA